MKRVAMPRRAAPLVRTRLTRRRAFRRFLTYQEEYATKRRILLTRPCHLCGHRSQHVHHRQLRSQGGGNEWPNLVPLCWWCHDAVHRSPHISHILGLVVWRHESPANVPVLPLASLPAAARLRLTRPAYDWRAMQRQIDAENGSMGPEWPPG